MPIGRPDRVPVEPMLVAGPRALLLLAAGAVLLWRRRGVALREIAPALLCSALVTVTLHALALRGVRLPVVLMLMLRVLPLAALGAAVHGVLAHRAAPDARRRHLAWVAGLVACGALLHRVLVALLSMAPAAAGPAAGLLALLAVSLFAGRLAPGLAAVLAGGAPAVREQWRCTHARSLRLMLLVLPLPLLLEAAPAAFATLPWPLALLAAIACHLLAAVALAALCAESLGGRDAGSP